MKHLINTLLILIFTNCINAQTINTKFGFNLYTLSIQKAYAINNILPRVENGNFYYFDKQNGQKKFDISFEEAYPFIGKSALIKKNGKYGIIDLNGNYLIEPTYENYSLPPYEDEAYLIIFSDELTFDLNSGTNNENGYTICEESAVPDFIAFKNKNNKYGIKKQHSNEIIIEAKYDSIIDMNFDFFIVKLDNKIGVIDTKGQTIIPLDYTQVTFSRGMYYSFSETIGFKRGNNWTYFDLPTSEPKAMLSSQYKCVKMHDLLLENSIGIFEQDKGLNILFKNGKTLNNDYDWISENGLIGIKNESVYFLNSDGSSTLYYEKSSQLKTKN